MDLSQFRITGDQERVFMLKLHNSRLIKLRWFYLSTLTIIAATANYVAGHHDLTKRYIIICLTGLALNALLLLINNYVLNKKQALRGLMVLQLTLDLAIAAYVTYGQGGLHARTAILFSVPIVAAGLIFTHRVVYLTAVMAGAAYALSVVLYNSNRQLPYHLSEILVPLVFYPALFLVIAQLVVYLMRITTEDTREQAYDAFLALLSHQLKHPISTANAIIDQLEYTKPQFHPEQKKYINMLKAENQSLLLLLNNLLETSAPSEHAHSSDEVDILKLLRQTATQSAEKHSRVNDLKLQLPETAYPIPANSERIKTAFANLLNNAFQYSKPGTPVKLSLHEVDNETVITIEDKGEGMNKRAKQQLFRKYSIQGPSDRGIQGVGLGLFVSRKIIDAYCGTLDIESDKSGTKVTITLKRGSDE